MRIAPPVSTKLCRGRAIVLFALLSLLPCLASAQSTTIEFPTPVRETQISGSIAPRDLGDPRLTSYFYAFNGTPGDLIVTVESNNLEGDVDVFTAGTLRPLAKVSMYGGTGNRATKTIFLKNRESLILRVEARTPNDVDGSYRVRFDGSFEPFVGEARVAPEIAAATPPATVKKGRRVNSVGARIEEPEPEPEPSPSVASKPEESTPAAKTSTETPAENPETAAKSTRTQPTRTTTPRTRRNTRPTSRNTRTRPATTARKTQPPPETQPTPAPEPASGPRLIIETRDGTRVERFMTTVRRVTVENGQIVVITKDGKVDRQPMSNVLRMAIEP